MSLALQSRIFEKMTPVPEAGCWLWDGAVDKQWGYGWIRVGRKMKKAHRVSFEAFKGPIPRGLLICHKCDVPSCVNPDHLYSGTNLQNMRDRHDRGR